MYSLLCCYDIRYKNYASTQTHTYQTNFKNPNLVIEQNSKLISREEGADGFLM